MRRRHSCRPYLFAHISGVFDSTKWTSELRRRQSCQRRLQMLLATSLEIALTQYQHDGLWVEIQSARLKGVRLPRDQGRKCSSIAIARRLDQ